MASDADQSEAEEARVIREMEFEDKIARLEQQLAQAREEAEHFAELGQEADIKAVAVLEENAAMRALLVRFAGMLRESFREDGFLVGEGFNVSLSDQLQFCREVRAFLAQQKEQSDG